MEKNKHLLEPITSIDENSFKMQEIGLTTANILSDVSKQYLKHKTCFVVKDDTCAQSQLTTLKSKMSGKRIKQLNLKQSVSNTENATTSRCTATIDCKEEKTNIYASKSETSCCADKLSANRKEVPKRNGVDRKVSNSSTSNNNHMYVTNLTSTNNENKPTRDFIVGIGNKRGTTNITQLSEKFNTAISSGDSEKISRNNCIIVNNYQTEVSKVLPENDILYNTNQPLIGTKNASAQLCRGDAQDNAVNVMSSSPKNVRANIFKPSSAELCVYSTEEEAIDHLQDVMPLCSTKVSTNTNHLSSICSDSMACEFTTKLSPISLFKAEIPYSALVHSSDDTSIKSHIPTSKSRRSRKRAQQSNMKMFSASSEDAQTDSSNIQSDQKEISHVYVSKSESLCSTIISRNNPKEPPPHNSFEEREDSSVCVSKSETSCIENLSIVSSERTLKSTNTHFVSNEIKRNFTNHTPKIDMTCTTIQPPNESEKLSSSDYLAVSTGKRENLNIRLENEIVWIPNLVYSDMKKDATSGSSEDNANTTKEEKNQYVSKVKVLCCENVPSAKTEPASTRTSSCIQVNDNEQENIQTCVLRNTNNDYSHSSSVYMQSMATSVCVAGNNDINNKSISDEVQTEVINKIKKKSSTNAEKARRCIPVANDKTENMCISKTSTSCTTTAELLDNMSVDSEQTTTRKRLTVNHNIDGKESNLVFSKSDKSPKLVTISRKTKVPHELEQTLTNVYFLNNDKPKKFSTVSMSKSDSSCKVVEKTETNTYHVKTSQSKTKKSKLEHGQVVKSNTSILKTEISNDHNNNIPFSASKQNHSPNSTEATNGKRKKFHRSNSTGASLKQKARYSLSSSSEEEGTYCQKEKQNITRHKQNVSKSISLSKVKETLDDSVRPITAKFNSKNVSENIECENKPIKIGYSQLSKCSLNVNGNKHKGNSNKVSRTNEITTPSVNVYTHNSEHIARSLEVGKCSQAEHKANITPKSDSTNTIGENIQNSPSIHNDQEVKTETLSTKKSRRRKKTKSTEIQQTENCMKSTDPVSSKLNTFTIPSENKEKRSKLKDKSRPKREKKHSLHRTSLAKLEELKDTKHSPEDNERNCKPNIEGNISDGSLSYNCRNSTRTSTNNRCFLRMLFASIARFFGRKEPKSRDDITKMEMETASVSKSGNTSPRDKTTNIDGQNKLVDGSNTNKNAKQNEDLNIPPPSINSKDKRKHKHGLKSILKKKSSSSDVCIKNIRSINELSSIAIGDQKRITTTNRDDISLLRTSENFKNSNVSKCVPSIENPITAPVAISTGSSISPNCSPSSSTDTLGHALLSTSLGNQYLPPYKSSRRYPLGYNSGRFKGVLSTVKETDEIIFRRHSEEDLSELRKISEEEKSYLENVSECDDMDAQEINRKLRLLLRHKGIRIENLRAVLRLREKLLCRNSDEILNLKKQLLISQMRIQRLCEMFLNLKKAHNELTTRAREVDAELRDVTNAVKALPTSTGKKKPTAAEKLIEEVKKNARLTEENARLKEHLSSFTNARGVPFEPFNFK